MKIKKNKIMQITDDIQLQQIKLNKKRKQV